MSIRLLKNIYFQYLKTFDEESLTDEERVSRVQSLLNPLINGDVNDAEMPQRMLGVDLNWAAGGSNDSVVEVVFNNVGIQQDLKKRTRREAEISLRMPQGLNVSYDTKSGVIDVSWGVVPGAAGYRVIRDFQTPNQETIINGTNGYTTSNGIASFSDNVNDNVEHTYVVLAKNPGKGQGGPNAVNNSNNSAFTPPKVGKAFLKAGIPTSFTASNNTLEEAVELTWDPMPNSYGYTIKRDGNVIATNHQSTSYTDNVGNNSEYTYSIKSEGEIDAADSAYSSGIAGKGYSITNTPASLSASYNTLEESIELTWSSDSNATGYTIKRDGNVIAINHQSTSYTDNVGNNNEHTYSIKSEGEVDAADSAYSSGVVGKGYAKASVPTGLSASDNTLKTSVSLSWNNMPNATGYTIKRDGNVIATNHQSTSYTDSVGDGSYHTYEVKSEGEVDAADSAYSSSVNGRGYRTGSEFYSETSGGGNNYSISLPSGAFDITLEYEIVGGGSGGNGGGAGGDAGGGNVRDGAGGGGAGGGYGLLGERKNGTTTLQSLSSIYIWCGDGGNRGRGGNSSGENGVLGLPGEDSYIMVDGQEIDRADGGGENNSPFNYGGSGGNDRSMPFGNSYDNGKRGGGSRGVGGAPGGTGDDGDFIGDTSGGYGGSGGTAPSGHGFTFNGSSYSNIGRGGNGGNGGKGGDSRDKDHHDGQNGGSGRDGVALAKITYKYN